MIWHWVIWINLTKFFATEDRTKVLLKLYMIVGTFF